MRYRPAPVSPASDAAVDPVQVLQAPNGVEVHLLSTSLPRSSVALLSFENPLVGDREAHALLPDLLTRGTARAPGLAEMAARCEELYEADLISAVTAHGATQVMRLGVEVLADRYAGGRRLFDEATALLAEVLHEPPLEAGRFREDHLAQERDNLARAIAGLRDDRGLLAYRRLIELMHAGQPWALHSWGDEASAAELDEARVHAAWDHLRGDAPVRLAIVGEVQPEQALAAAERLGGSGPRRRPATHVPPPTPGERPVREGTLALPLAQSQLVLGHRVDPTSLPGPACPLLATVLGGGSHSRLFKRVREDEGLAYGCSASLLVDSATLVVQAGIPGDQAQRVRDLVAGELQRLVAGDLDEAELALSRDAMLARLDGIVDSPRDLMSWRLFSLSNGREPRPDVAARRLREATADDVCRAACGVALDSVFLLEGQST